MTKEDYLRFFIGAVAALVFTTVALLFNSWTGLIVGVIVGLAFVVVMELVLMILQGIVDYFRSFEPNEREYDFHDQYFK